MFADGLYTYIRAVVL